MPIQTQIIKTNAARLEFIVIIGIAAPVGPEPGAVLLAAALAAVRALLLGFELGLVPIVLPALIPLSVGLAPVVILVANEPMVALPALAITAPE